MSKTETQIRYAGVWYRFLARIIDNMIISFVGAPFLIVEFIIGFQSGWNSIISGSSTAEIHYTAGQSLLIGFSTLAYVLVGVCYFIFFNSSKFQATPGKMILGIKITNLDGQRLTRKQALIRYFATDGIGLPGNLLSNSTNQTAGRISLPFLIMQGLWTIVDASIGGADSRKRMLHDQIAKTLVVYK